jgi:DNA helicase HerA-like ATPase
MRFIHKGERGLIVGQTGSGKSVLLKALLRYAPIAPVVILDTKGEDFGGVPLPQESMERISSIDEFDRRWRRPVRKIPDYILIEPDGLEASDPDALDGYLQIIDRRKIPTVVGIDEAYMLHRSGRAGPGLTGLLTRGRSKGISTILASQRPKWLSRFCLTEATVIYVFQLIDTDDRKRIAEVSPYLRDTIPNRYSFYSWAQGDKGYKYNPPLNIPKEWDNGYTVETYPSYTNWI